jgi:hypothetical protein
MDAIGMGNFKRCEFFIIIESLSENVMPTSHGYVYDII